MSGYLNFIYEVLKQFFVSLFNSIKEFFVNIFNAFNIYYYIKIFYYYKYDFNGFEFFLAIISILVLIMIFLVIVYFIYLLVKKIIRITKNSMHTENLIMEIGILNKDIIKLSKERDKLLQGATLALGDDSSDNRFYKLIQIDNKYKNYNKEEEKYCTYLNLKSLCDAFRNYAAGSLGLFYDIRTIRLFISGFGISKLLLLQGISGTGKTSLPYAFGKFLENDSYIVAVQPSWKDKNEIIGYFNEFTKKFNETEILKVLYEATYTDNIYIIVLDEMNIARVEYYFAEMLSLIEMREEDRYIEVTSDVWESDPVHLKAGKLLVPNNIWFVGTANNDESTFSISDKVYDRSMVLNINTKGAVFTPNPSQSAKLSYSYFNSLLLDALNKYKMTNELKDKIKKIDNMMIDKFSSSFGNRILNQLEGFISMYIECGGSELDAIDYFLSSKILPKLESANLSFYKQELDELEKLIVNSFTKDAMVDCIKYIRTLKLRY